LLTAISAIKSVIKKKRKYGKNKLKLNIWNNNIKDAIKHNKIAHKEWKEAGKPKCPLLNDVSQFGIVVYIDCCNLGHQQVVLNFGSVHANL
jgi:hypothetical protein